MLTCILMMLFCANDISGHCEPPWKATLYADQLQTDTRKSGPQMRVLAGAVVAAESAYNAEALSDAGAYGLFQIMPITEKHINESNGIKLRRTDWQDNIQIGLLYLEELMGTYNGNIRRVLAAYNWGPARVPVVGPLPHLPPETRTYIKRVKGYMKCSNQ